MCMTLLGYKLAVVCVQIHNDVAVVAVLLVVQGPGTPLLWLAAVALVLWARVASSR
jgi:hypothetical protein